jgi:hypothetical protein
VLPLVRACLVIALAVLAEPGVVSSALTRQAADPDAKKLVLQLSDVPRSFIRSEGDYRSNAELARRSKIRLSKVESWGRIGGYTVKYDRPGTSGSSLPRGPLFIISTVSVHRASTGAHRAFVWGSSEFSRRGSKTVRTGARLGDESQVFTSPIKEKGVVFRLFAVQWRESRFVATASVLGADGKVTVESALGLARRQQIRLRKVR